MSFLESEDFPYGQEYELMDLYDNFGSNCQENSFYGEIYQRENLAELLGCNGKKAFIQENSEENASKSTGNTTEKKSDEKLIKEKSESKTENTNNTDNKENKENKEIKETIFSITKVYKENKESNLLGKKRFDESHTKHAFDNIVRKIKSKLFGAILIILNKSLEEKKLPEKKVKNKENHKEKKGEIKSECFLKPEQQIILQTNVTENLALLDMQLREIFSNKVSEKAKNFSKQFQLDYNKNFIEKIKYDENKQRTNDILDMTFFQCLEHFRGSQRYEALDGLEIEYRKVVEEMNYDIEYKNNFIEHLNNYEVLFRNKKPRKSKKKLVNKDEENFY